MPVTQITLPTETGSLRITVMRSARAKRIALRLDSVRGAVLVLPKHTPLAQGEAFLLQHQNWLAERIHKLSPSPCLGDGSTVLLYGRSYRLSHRPQAKRGVWLDGDQLCVSGRQEYITRRTLDFLKAEAIRHIVPKAQTLAATVFPRPVTVAIKDTRSRWGSCGRDGRLSFCWRLILAPEWVMDAVIAHEVAHLVEMNHSAAFWRVVETLAGDPAPSRQWLKEHGDTLLRFGR